MRRRGAVLRALPIAVTAAVAAEGWHLRRRAGALVALTPSEAPVSDDHRFVVASGVALDEATCRAASAHARTHGLSALDLVPGDLPSGRLLELLRLVDPTTYRSDRLATGRSAGQVLLVTAELEERAGLADLAHDLDRVEPAEFVAVAEQVKRYAAVGVDLAVATGLRAGPDRPDQQAAVERARFGGAAPVALGLPLATWSALAAGVAARPLLGAVAAAAWSAQPAVVASGAAAVGVAPADLPAGAVRRLARDPVRWVRAAASWRRAPTRDLEDAVESRRPGYQAELAAGTGRFFEPRRPDCPWCGDRRLVEVLVTGDLLQHKPGRFVLEQCEGCGHVFQNPRLTPEGLDFYYRDFYDGLGGNQLEFVFGSSPRPYRGRADMVRAAVGPVGPDRWLDVGAGHGHFCNVARDTFPTTRFDGLDLSDSIEEAARRGWVDHGYRGLFPELADDLAGAYDVVSMHHYLEHTRQPFEELDAAARVVRPGGHLLIELPDPECAWGRILGRRWVPWFQPQHQHLAPLGNLELALVQRGFTPVAVERAPADQPVDLTFAVWLTLNQLAPSPARPWAATRPGDTGRHVAALALGAPVLLAALVADNLMHLARRRRGTSNTYRVLARREGG